MPDKLFENINENPVEEVIKLIKKNKNIDAEKDKNAPYFYKIGENGSTKRENVYNNYDHQISSFVENKRISDIPKFGKIKQFNKDQDTIDMLNKYHQKQFQRKFKTDHPKSKKNLPRNTKKNRYNANYYKHFYQNINNTETNYIKREFSIDVNDFGEQIKIFDFDYLNSLKIKLKDLTEERIGFKGTVYSFDKSVEKISPQNRLKLQNSPLKSSKLHTRYEIEEDSIIEDNLDKADIFISDLLLATIMTATKSYMGWDIIVKKKDDKLFFYKRRESDVEKEFCMNTKSKTEDLLSKTKESSKINDNFIFSSLNSNEQLKFDPNSQKKFDHLITKPTKNSTENKNSTEKKLPNYEKAFQYKIFGISENTKILVKCQIDTFVKNESLTKKEKTFDDIHLLSLKALNEYEEADSANSWRCRLDNQKGSVLVDEVRQNNFKIARWAAQAQIGGIDQIRIGFVSRSKNKKPFDHFAQATIKESPVNLMSQMGIYKSNLWAIFKEIADFAMENLENDKKCILVKDPNNDCLLLFEKTAK
ncbi:hypothetical protein MHBO_002345 [Bonamia ostreae]|uniref:Eukaryotic translation initiation factor 3 subunit D n=1 Tax=Bonamia ostreae TaxID=126728 RepID=A0ABV2ALZ1_9EUKA